MTYNNYSDSIICYYLFLFSSTVVLFVILALFTAIFIFCCRIMTSMDIDSPSTPIMAITPVIHPDNNEAPISEEQPNKRRRKKSIVWEHFTIETVGAGCMRACCKQCKKSFAYITGSKLAGTSTLSDTLPWGSVQ